MNDLLTTRQLQEMFQVDRITIYRMLEDGRLHGFKVGGQWRFLRRDVERWLQAQQLIWPSSAANGAAHSKSSTPAESTALPLACVQAIQDILAEACQVASITLSADGAPVTEISNSCAFCNLILSTSEGRRRCLDSWQLLSDQPSTEPKRCHAGLTYVTAPVTIDGQRVALVAAGQLLAGLAAGEPDEPRLARLSEDCSLDSAALRQASGELRIAQPERIDWLSKLMQRAASTFAELGRERGRLLERLQRIAQMTVVE